MPLFPGRQHFLNYGLDYQSRRLRIRPDIQILPEPANVATETVFQEVFKGSGSTTPIPATVDGLTALGATLRGSVGLGPGFAETWVETEGPSLVRIINYAFPDPATAEVGTEGPQVVKGSVSLQAVFAEAAVSTLLGNVFRSSISFDGLVALTEVGTDIERVALRYRVEVGDAVTEVSTDGPTVVKGSVIIQPDPAEAAVETSIEQVIAPTVHELILQPDEAYSLDTMVREETPNGDFGIGSSMETGRAASSGTRRRGLIKFQDLVLIPPNSEILSAVLQLHTTSVQNTTARNTTVHRSLVEWFEGDLNGSTPFGGEEGSTWNNRNDLGPVAWNGGAGGGSGSDFVATPTATVSVTTVATNYHWNVAADVQGWVNGSNPNHGWWVLGVEGVAAETRKFFGSASASPSTSRPRLAVEYATSQKTEIIQPAEAQSIDTYIDSTNAATNFGNAGVLNCEDRTSPSRIMRSLIRFDLSGIPVDATITAAFLVLVKETGAFGPRQVNIHRSLVEWFEGTGAASGNRSTWNHRNANGAVSWPGGAGGASGSAWVATPTDEVSVSHFPRPYIWNVTPDVQGFVDGSNSNFGWWLMLDATATTNHQQFKSSAHADVADRPKLIVHYQ